MIYDIESFHLADNALLFRCPFLPHRPRSKMNRRVLNISKLGGKVLRNKALPPFFWSEFSCGLHIKLAE